MSTFTGLTLNSAALARLMAGQGTEGAKVHAHLARTVELVAADTERHAPTSAGFRTIVFDDTITPGGRGAFPRRRLAVLLTHSDAQARGGSHAILLAALDAAR